MEMVDSQSRSNSNWAHTLGIDDEEEEEAKAPELVSTCWGHPGANSYLEANIYTPKKSSSRSLARLAMVEVAPSNISIVSLNFASLSSPSFLANSCTFLISVWRLIKDLTQFAPAMVPGQRRRVLFIIRLKNRKIFGLCFLCLSCDAHNSSGILGSWKWKNLEHLQDSEARRCRRTVLLGHLI